MPMPLYTTTQARRPSAMDIHGQKEAWTSALEGGDAPAHDAVAVTAAMHKQQDRLVSKGLETRIPNVCV